LPHKVKDALPGKGEIAMTVTQLIRRIAALILICICVWSWVALGASLLFDWPRDVLVIAVFAAALSTEAALWGGAVLLGWTALANRASLIGRFTGGRA
jgi:hypothetical protein